MKSLVSKVNNLRLNSDHLFPVVIITAPSGSGKSTLIQMLLEDFDCFGFSISATTRQPRGQEQEGQDYYFLTPHDFEKSIEQGDFLEWEMVYEGLYYGTFKSEMERIGNRGQVPLLDIDVQGALNLSEYFGPQALKVFIKPPSLEVLEERLRKRATDQEEKIQERILKAEEELSYQEKFDVIIINDDLERAYQEFKEVIVKFLEEF